MNTANKDAFINLSKPPIIETALCVAFQGVSLDKDAALSLASEVAPGFTLDHDLQSQLFVCKSGSTAPVVQPTVWNGARFVKDGHLFLTLQNGMPGSKSVIFAFSILPPYQSWNDFRDIALPVFDKFRKQSTIAEAKMVRVGVRTINSLSVSSPYCPMTDVLVSIPSDIISNERALAHEFVYRDTVEYPERKLSATVTRFKSQARNNQVAIMLDIDVFTHPTSIWSETMFFERLEAIHTLRDELFFGSVAKKQLEAYK